MQSSPRDISTGRWRCFSFLKLQLFNRFSFNEFRSRLEWYQSQVVWWIDREHYWNNWNWAWLVIKLKKFTSLAYYLLSIKWLELASKSRSIISRHHIALPRSKSKKGKTVLITAFAIENDVFNDCKLDWNELNLSVGLTSLDLKHRLPHVHCLHYY